MAHERQRTALFISVYETGLRIGAIWLGWTLGQPVSAVLFFAIAGALISIVYLMWILRLAGASPMDLLRPQWPALLVTALALCSMLVWRAHPAPGAAVGVALAVLLVEAAVFVPRSVRRVSIAYDL